MDDVDGFQCQCEEGGDHVGSCEDHDHDHHHEGHDTAHDVNDGSHKTRLCCVCSEGFATKSSLDNHVKIQTNWDLKVNKTRKTALRHNFACLCNLG